jgi:hypothetical protein
MSTAAVALRISAEDVTSAGRGRPALVGETCSECGRTLKDFEEHACADCLDLAAHAWCRECGGVLPDGDLEAGVCASCEA